METSNVSTLNESLCPKCEANLPPRLSSGRLVCSKCGWSDSPRKVETNNDLGYQLIGQIKNALTPLPNVSDVYTNESESLDIPAKDKTKVKIAHTGSARVLLGGLSLLAGLFTMYSGLSYDISVSSSNGYGRIVNDGKVSDRISLVNVGGFLAVCGSIFITSGRSCSVNSKREIKRINQDD
jgi:ribosomal protein L40E